MKKTISSYYTNNISFADRVATIADNGFDGIMIKWQSDKHGDKHQLVKLSRQHNLDIVNMHCIYDDINSMWTGGTHVTEHLLDCVNNCHYYGIPSLVVHLSGTTTPPPPNILGIQALDPVVQLADKLQVQLAIENLRKPEFNMYVHSHFDSPYVGMCYDCGHENVYYPDIDIVSHINQPVFTTHLHDNYGLTDSHNLPTVGTVNWNKVAKTLAKLDEQYINIESRMDKDDHCHNEFLMRAKQLAEYIEQLVLSNK